MILVVLPACAASRFSGVVDWRILVGVPVVMSVAAFFSYRNDKRRAEAGEWRTPESTLHFLELLGGWPGAFLAQRWFRHKTAEVSYRFVFWLIVFTYEFLAVDSLIEWRIVRQVWHLIHAKLS